jgi:glycosyltransferase involved in cell wall biosynthesis
MFGWEFPPFRAGGLATATMGLVKGLARRGVDVTLVVPFVADESTLPGLRLVSAPRVGERLATRRLDALLSPYTSAATYAVERARTPTAVYGRDLFTEVDRYAALAGAIAADEPHDVIDSHDWLTFAAGLHARSISARPMVAHIHATELDRAASGNENPVILGRERDGLHAADRIIANSRFLERRVVDDFGVAAHRVDVVHWGVDGPRVDPTEPVDRALSRPVVLFVGRVTYQKGPRYFVDLARRVAAFLPRARFVIAGDGDAFRETVDYAADIGVADRILFTGGLSQADVQRVYQLADVCVMPSVHEPYGLVALESIRNGTPCIIPIGSGVAEVLQNAFKVDFWDVDAMTNAVVALARYPVLHDTLRERGLDELNEPRFTLDEPARRTEAVYQHAIEDAAR